MRLADFQIFARTGTGDRSEQRKFNECFFAVYEPTRLWIRDNKIQAPFRKLLVSVADQQLARTWHDHVSCVDGVCEVTEAINLDDLRHHVDSTTWIASLALRGIEAVAAKTHWQNAELSKFLREMMSAPFPYSYRFNKFHRRFHNTSCDLAIEFGVRSTDLFVVFSERESLLGKTVIIHRDGPLFLEDDFPVAGSTIREGSYVLLDRNKSPLATVSLPLPSVPV